MPSHISLLAPVISLNLWTFTMEAWMYALRIPAITKYKVDANPNMTKESMNARFPPHVRWPADNYNHLHEQPTQFYAVALTLALLGKEGGVSDLDVKLAWAYVGLRVVHSLVQSVSNRIMVRFGLFAGSSVVLLGLTARVAQLVFGKLA